MTQLSRSQIRIHLSQRRNLETVSVLLKPSPNHLTELTTDYQYLLVEDAITGKSNEDEI